MNEKLKQLKDLLADSGDIASELTVDKSVLVELLATVEAVTAPNMRLALHHFQEHVTTLQDRLDRQVEAINRLLKINDDMREKYRGK